MACDDKHIGGIWQVTWQMTHTYLIIWLVSHNLAMMINTLVRLSRSNRLINRINKSLYLLHDYSNFMVYHNDVMYALLMYQAAP